LPLILGGLRTATLQVVATATVAAYASLGGLGRYLIDGINVRQFHIALVGALMVAALALILDAALGFAIWASAPGTGRLRRRPPIGSNVTDHASKSPGRSPNVDP
jgi:osmoprotectant transport system permease protein